VNRTHALNYALYQTGWLACILGAAWGWETAGVVIAFTLTAAHVGLARDRGVECRLIAVALGIGFVVESLQIASGTYESDTFSLTPGAPPAWLLALWAQFATTFRYSLRGVLSRPVRAALFGATGGPLAFVAADRLDALALLPPFGTGLLRIALAWTLALLIVSWLTRRWSPSDLEPDYRAVYPGR
jgi:hypothetical protein